MKNINLNNSSDLLKFKNEINTVLEGRIKKAELSESVKNFKNLTLGDLNKIFESVSDKLFDSARGKKIIARYVNALKENKELGKAFAIYHVISSPEHVSDVNMFLSETASLAGNINKKRVCEGKVALSSIVKDAVTECGLSAEDIKKTISENTNINAAIEYLINNKRTANNIYEYVNSLSLLKEHVIANAKEPLTESNDKSVKSLMGELLETLNEGGLEQWERDAVFEIVSARLSNGSTEQVFESRKKSCVDKIDELLNGQKDVSEKSRLSSMKQQLEAKHYCEDTISEDIINLYKLYHTLSE